MAQNPNAAAGAPAPTNSTALAMYPLTMREWILGGIGLLLLINSFLPIASGWGGGYFTIWNLGGWLPSLLMGVLPLLTAGLLAVRRLAPNVPWRVGSLTVDQFASVIGIIVALQFFTYLVSGASGLAIILGFFLSLGWVFFASFAHLVPPFNKEFTERPVGQPISLLARSSVLPLAQPVRPVAVQPAAAAAAPAVPGQPSAAQPFWVLSPEERPVVDDSGATLFTVGPAAWALVVEDRGSEYVIRADDGSTGTLKNVTGVSRA